MLNLIDWKKKLRVNGMVFENSADAYDFFKNFDGDVVVEFNFKERKITATGEVQAEKTEEEYEDQKLYRVKVRQYMTKPPTQDFDFHTKWNGGREMPMRIMVGKVVGETPGMYKMDLFAKPMPSSICMVCGKTLTHPVSLIYGIGPECGRHFHMNPFDTEEELEASFEQLKQRMADIEWCGWIPKKAFEEMEVIEDAE